MQRLSLAELKAKKNNVVANLEAIKGGNTNGCHQEESFWDGIIARMKKGPIVLF